MVFETALLSSYLAEYYRRLFPYDLICEWLSYGKDYPNYFQMREFAFILEGDVHMRFRSFINPEDFEQVVQRTNPQKIDIGAVYNHKPVDNKKFADFRAVERELVFDIDLTDYDEIRNCCSEANVCEKCWRWISIAVKILDHFFENHFDFKHRLWVFSGRRGIHCWIVDENARKLTNAGRSSIAEYLTLMTQNKPSTQKSAKSTYIHPMLNEVYDIVMKGNELDKMVVEQGWLTDDGLDKILESIKNPIVLDEYRLLVEQIKQIDPAEDRWNALRIKLDPIKRKMLQQTDVDIKLCKPACQPAISYFRTLVLKWTYPRLDVNVSTGINHLLKSPFCVHPKTGLIAVPIAPSEISKTKLSKLPRIDALLRQIAYSKVKSRTLNKYTSLAPHIETFEAFLKLLRDPSQ